MPQNKGYLTSRSDKDSDEMYTPYYAVEPILKYIPKDKKIWCPFDKEWSAFYQSFDRGGYDVELKMDYENLGIYEKVFISKVFTDTFCPVEVLKLENVSYGGTGFYYDKAPKLPEEIEHHMPDYHLYDEWVEERINNGDKRNEYKYYLDYSIGFTTRGCFRQCQFCVNKNYKKVECHSPLNEFLDPTRKKICLLDDNVLGSSCWKEIITELQETGKPFQFKQGLDERILTDEKCELLFSSKYDSQYIFAFDNVEDSKIIENKLKLIRKYTNKIPMFYVFCGFDRNDKWDDEFWKQDLIDLWKRIKILMMYHCLPYIMRFNRYEESPYKTHYVTVARWCNQPAFFKKKSINEFAELNQKYMKTENICSSVKSLELVKKDIPELDEKYFNMKWETYK